MHRIRFGALLTLIVAATARASGPALPPGVSPDWWSSVQQSIRRADRELRPGADGAWVASNCARGFTATFSDHAIAVTPCGEKAPAWSWGLRTEASRRPAVGNRIDYASDRLTEAWINDEDGLTHRIEIPRPAFLHGGELRVTLPIVGELRPVLRGDSIEFLEGHTIAIRYGSLAVTDANGRQVGARLSLDNVHHAIEIVAQPKDVAFPLTIIAQATTSTWNVGFNSVAAAGDVNGDGYGDVIVGYQYYSNGETSEGTAMVFYGSASGLSTTPNWQIESNEADARMGNSVAGGGDVNADGYDDVVVGCYRCSNGQSHEGRVFVYFGSASGLATSPAWTVERDVADAQFGYSVAITGDVNGDGKADVIVGCPNCSDGVHTGDGLAIIYYNPGTEIRVLTGGRDGAAFGTSVASAGDTDGDGYADVIVGAPGWSNGQTNEGAFFVYPGSNTGVAGAALLSVESNVANAKLGISVASAGDTNGDGYADIIVGASGYTNDTALEGRAYVYYGSATGPTGTPWITEGNNLGSDYGFSVSGAGDVNGDGYADVIVGADQYQSAGRAYIYLGSKTGLSTTPVWTSDGNTNSGFASAVAGVGDINGDGYADVIVAVPGNGFGLIYEGSGSGYSLTADWYHDGTNNGTFGLSVAGAGDVNGDGLADVIVGDTVNQSAYVFLGQTNLGLSIVPDWTVTKTGMNFGGAVAGAGDVNGDGYDDVIVGASSYANGETSEGAAFVYYGGASGLSTTAAWTVESNHANANFGSSVAGAGDVNGDGYSDVIVGSVNYTNTLTWEGAAFVYLGSSTGLSTTAAWTRFGGQDSAHFGTSVAGAGDVNGDGYADIIVGSDYYTDNFLREGRAYVYHGSPQGLSSTPNWTVDGNQTDGRFGVSVASAGDVNGDGYADVIVGAWRYDLTQTDEGAAFVYHGSASGLGVNATVALAAGVAGAGFGTSVAGAGDVNGDGFADVLVGAPSSTPNGGAAYLYLGSASGVIGPPSAWSANAGVTTALFGGSVAGVGDVNGDGFADGLIGASGYNNVGRTFLYFGNQSAGRNVRPVQFRVPDDVQVGAFGLSRDDNKFDLYMQNVSPRGREAVRLQMEACPPGSPFGSVNCVTAISPFWAGTVNGDIGLIGSFTGLGAYKLYHWRARTLYGPYTFALGCCSNPPKPPHGPWRRFLAQWREADVRTGTTNAPPAPTGLAALCTVTTQIDVTWNSVPDAYYEIDRKDPPNAAWIHITNTATNSYSDTNVLPNTAYAYRVRAVRGSQTSVNSVPDAAITYLFSDDPLPAGMKVKATHLANLQFAAGKLADLAGTSASFTDAAAVGLKIKDQQLTQLRIAVNNARIALGMPTPAYTDNSSLFHVKIKAIHFQELRDRIR